MIPELARCGLWGQWGSVGALESHSLIPTQTDWVVGEAQALLRAPGPSTVRGVKPQTPTEGQPGALGLPRRPADPRRWPLPSGETGWPIIPHT